MITPKELTIANRIAKRLLGEDYQFKLHSADYDDDELLCERIPLSIFHQDKKYILMGITTIPGCHTMPNGDPGYPDDVDIFDISQHDTFIGALQALFQQYFNDAVNNTFRDELESLAYEAEPDFWGPNADWQK